MVVTAKEIARIVGVSAATVSIVLNNRPGVGKEVRSAILEVARTMGYEKKSKRAKNVKADTAHSLCLIVYEKHGAVVANTPFFAELIQAIEHAVRNNGYSLMVFYYYEQDDCRAQIRAIEAAAPRGVILLATEMTGVDMRYFDRLSMPLVLLDNTFHDRSIDSITINNVQGASEATRYLLSMGKRNIGHLCSSVSITNFAERRDGFLAAAAGADRPPATVFVSSTSEGAYNDMKAHLASKPSLPDAFFADNDIIALACIRALREAGYRVPDDISIIGFDDMAPAAISHPPLTTMRVPRATLGSVAVERLINAIKTPAPATMRISLNTTLIERGSVTRKTLGEK